MTKKSSKYSTSTICGCLTVIDEENRPIGAITVDDVVSKLVSA